MVEGFTMGNQRYTMKSLATIEAQTAAYGAENAAAQGAVINMVTKSGSNRFEFDVSAFYEDSRLSPFRSRLRSAGAGDPARTSTPASPAPSSRTSSGTTSTSRPATRAGPGIPIRPGFMPTLPAEDTLLARGSFKLTWQLEPAAQDLQLLHVQPGELGPHERRQLRARERRRSTTRRA